MSDKTEIADQKARSRALVPDTSFIVQAPAGSGKTGLLTQRFLVLLAGVDAPEEIVAITFTRKAASEMRQRILQALERAKQDPPREAHERHTWDLAQKALARDRAQDWRLLENPSRLRIQTIDSLCASLARQMPILSRFGSVPAISEDAGALYLEAARNTITELESNAEWSDAIAHLVQHLDNRLDKLQGLISTMLAQRDQWLRHVADPDHPKLERANLEAAMERLVSEALAELVQQAPVGWVAELTELARFAAEQLEETGGSPIVSCANLKGLPGAHVPDRRQWEGLAELLLTSDGSWRKQVTKNVGFPAPTSAKDAEQRAHLKVMKQRMTELLQSLQEEDGFRERLALLRELPPHRYTDAEWETLQALVELLRVAAAHLELVFGGQGQVDFSALSQAAIRALGEPEDPTDLALALDYRIRHLLVDEFQDTSFNQYELLKRLTAGWQPGDGHSLFVVGDPMQSIYRFREAEVGLFLAARENGIGQLPLEFLRLSVNFRSQAGIVDWINQHFPKVLPVDDKVADGAVSYAPSVAFHPPLAVAAVKVYPSLQRDDEAEARQVVAIVQRAKREFPNGSTAILVRSRNHLAQIVAQLQQAGLRFQAVDIERLAHRPVVQDLLALTRALSHRGDRIAWLALLRAPYCGLTLVDLHTLAADASGQALIDLLHQEQRIAKLSEDGRRRIARVLPVLAAALSSQAQCSLRSRVEGAWIALGGPACVTDETDLEDGEVYFQLLEKLGDAGEVPDIQELNQQVEQLFALPDVEADDSLQLMTVHKAKGLEFDSVILPGLGRSPGHDEERLLQWLERGHESGDSELLLAPISAHGEQKNPMAAYLQRLDKAKGHFEDGRLLYVAATRAKQRLHLLGNVDVWQRDDETGLKPPAKASLLARLWPVVENDFQSLLSKQGVSAVPGEDSPETETHSPARTRLAADWMPPAPPAPVPFTDATTESPVGESLEFDWAGETARHVGTVVHRLLQHIGKAGIDSYKPDDLPGFEAFSRNLLVRLGVAGERLNAAQTEVGAALKAMLDDERGRWILSNRHQQSGCEVAMSGVRDGKIKHMIIDRTFVDEHGTRWIIDYKTGTHSGGGVDEFLDREQDRYRQQLHAYASAMSKMETRPIRLGLYFPLLGGWREWSF